MFRLKQNAQALDEASIKWNKKMKSNSASNILRAPWCPDFPGINHARAPSSRRISSYFRPSSPGVHGSCFVAPAANLIPKPSLNSLKKINENKLSCPISSSTSISNANCYSYCSSSKKKDICTHLIHNQSTSIKEKDEKFCPFHLAEVQPRLRKGTEERHTGHQGGGAHAPGGHEPCRLRLGIRSMWNSPWSWRRKKRKKSNHVISIQSL